MRYLPLSEQDRKTMLQTIGASSVDELYADVPKAVLRKKPIEALPNRLGEIEVERKISTLAQKNLDASKAVSFLGAGAYYHHIPASVSDLISRGEFLTSYTPYQPEISQGTLQYLFEFQTQITRLTGMEVSNASMYDGASSTAEAIMMAGRITGRKKVLLSGGLHPQYSDVAKTHSHFVGFELSCLNPDLDGSENLADHITADYSCVVVQYPSFFGHLSDYVKLREKCTEHGVLLIFVVTEIVALGLLKSPGSLGADIVAAEGCSLGVGLNFGGPHLGILATRQKFIRQMPGRLVGQTTDKHGKRGWVLTLSTREQHIRREKATSNICTNSGLCTLAFTIHMTLLGEEGFKRLARTNHHRTVALVKKLKSVPQIKLYNKSFFNEFLIDLGQDAEKLVDNLVKQGIIAGLPVSRLYPKNANLNSLLLVAVTEMTTLDQMDQFVLALRKALS